MYLRANTLQPCGDIPIHEFLFVSPTRRHKRLHQRRSFSGILRTNSSEITFEENMRNFSTRLKNRDYPATTVEKHLSEVIFADRKKALEQRNKNARKKILPLPLCVAQPQEHTHGEMAPYTEPTIPEKHL